MSWRAHSGFKEYTFEFFREDDKIRYEVEIGDTMFVAQGVFVTGATDRLSNLCIYMGEHLLFQVSQHFLTNSPRVEFPRKLHLSPRSVFYIMLEPPEDLEPKPLDGVLTVSLYGCLTREVI
jgi:hypothetical protein